jgi:hypothetical protein
MMYFGDRPTLLSTRSRKLQTSLAEGRVGNIAKPTRSREKWSTTTAAHQQKGHAWFNENGSQGTQKLELEYPHSFNRTIIRTLAWLDAPKSGILDAQLFLEKSYFAFRILKLSLQPDQLIDSLGCPSVGSGEYVISLFLRCYSAIHET